MANENFGIYDSIGTSTPSLATKNYENVDCYSCRVSDSKSSVGLPYEAKKEKRKINTMSLCIALALDEKMYIAADSKSSVCAGKSSFGNKTKYSIPASFSYKKIFQVVLHEQDSSPIIGFSVGDNTFDSKNLSEFVKSLNFSDCTCIDNVAEVIKTSLNLNVNLVDINSSFLLFRYEDKKFKKAIIEKNDKAYDCNTGDFLPPQGEAIKSTAGADWAKELSEYMLIIIPEREEEGTVYGINQVFENAKIVGPYFDDSVGGLIHIGKLTPDGFTWLQNGYEL